jgi:LacI family transcriptional regulator, gluconate utilization system Gnt-I transcriptional repressor
LSPSPSRRSTTRTSPTWSAPCRLGRATGLLGATRYLDAEEDRLIEHLLRRRPEAILLTGGHHSDRARALLAQARIPVVETWDLPDTPIGHVVGFSNAAAIALAVDHLVARGRRRIAFIGGETAAGPGPMDRRGMDRRRGVRETLRRHGLPDDRLSRSDLPPTTMEAGAGATRALLAQWPDTDAIIGASDLIAFGAMTECQRMGRIVPDDIAVAGFGAYDISRLSIPRLLSIDPHATEIGSRAGALIAGLLRGTEAAAQRTIRIVPTLVPGESA